VSKFRGVLAFILVVAALVACGGTDVAHGPTANPGPTHSLLSVRAPAVSFTIATYNIEGYYHQTFPGDTASGLGASHLGAIVHNVRAMGLAVVGLQEYRDAALGDPRQIQAALANGWKGVYGRGRMAQLPILYDSNVVSLVASEYQSGIVGTPGCPPGSGSGEVNYAEFAIRATGARFVVANVHANSNWGAPCDTERLNLVRSVTRNTLVHRFRGPEFIIGDMNSAQIPLPGRSNNVPAYLAGTGFADAVTHATTGAPPGIASFGTMENTLASIDHVFYKNISAPSSYVTLACIPQATCGSDHRPVAATFPVSAFRAARS